MYKITKRIFDVLFSLVGLIIISPLFLIVMILNKISGEGEVFYFQERVGFQNRTFKIIKFATMLKDSANLKGGTITLREDPRITPTGKFLRRSKINELPQLINVLRGDMSFVGPRPMVINGFKKYSKEVQKLIYECKPGVTGIGSIIFRDEEQLVSQARSEGFIPDSFYREYIFPFKGKIELWYQKSQSFSVDVLILLLTIWVIFFSKSKLVYTIFSSLPRRNFDHKGYIK
jgi:lipopolysaccharide/colanic/teichoic acid biosynthesis glycosyltransferase